MKLKIKRSDLSSTEGEALNTHGKVDNRKKVIRQRLLLMDELYQSEKEEDNGYNKRGIHYGDDIKSFQLWGVPPLFLLAYFFL